MTNNIDQLIKDYFKPKQSINFLVERFLNKQETIDRIKALFDFKGQSGVSRDEIVNIAQQADAAERVRAEDFNNIFTELIKKGQIQQSGNNFQWVEDRPKDNSNNLELSKTVDNIKKLGYDYDVKGNTIILRSDDRLKMRDKVRRVLEPKGFIFDPLRGGSMGRLVKKTKNNKSNVFIKFKPKTPTGGGAAAAAGQQFELDLANSIAEKFVEEGITATTAGFGHGADLLIKSKTIDLNIEIKTALNADFGQFRLKYNINLKKWEPVPTAKFLEQKELFDKISKVFVEPYLNENAHFDGLIDHPSLTIRSGYVTGLKPNLQTGNLKLKLQNNWFKGKNDYINPFGLSMITEYYRNKGNNLIQIGTRGLYALELDYSDRLKIPYFSDAGLKAHIRFRIKPHSAFNGVHSFTVALKLRGKLEPSRLSLLDDKDLDLLIKAIQKKAS